MRVFQSTGIYPELFSKGGMPDEFIDLYRKDPVTTIEAVSLFSTPSHAAAWIKGVDSEILQRAVELSSHVGIVMELVKKKSISVKTINKRIKQIVKMSREGEPDEASSFEYEADSKAEKLTEAAAGIISTINSLNKQLFMFSELNGSTPVIAGNVQNKINILMDRLLYFSTITDGEYKTGGSEHKAGCWSPEFPMLGLSGEFTEEELHQAYRDKSKIYHPDSGGNDEQFQKLTDEYERAKQYATGKDGVN